MIFLFNVMNDKMMKAVERPIRVCLHETTNLCLGPHDSAAQVDQEFLCSLNPEEPDGQMSSERRCSGGI